MQGQGLASGMRTDGDAVGHGSSLQVVEAGIGHPVQRRVFGGGDQQAAACQHARDAAAEAVEQASEFIAGGAAGAVKDRPGIWRETLRLITVL